MNLIHKFRDVACRLTTRRHKMFEAAKILGIGQRTLRCHLRDMGMSSREIPKEPTSVSIAHLVMFLLDTSVEKVLEHHSMGTVAELPDRTLHAVLACPEGAWPAEVVSSVNNAVIKRYRVRYAHCNSCNRESQMNAAGFCVTCGYKVV